MHSEGNGTFAIAKLAVTGVAILVLAGCARNTSEVIAHAYVAPEKLNLRRDLIQRNSTAAVLSHGDRVDIIDVRRRWVKVRSPKGEEGWADSLQLLSQEQMDQIRQDDQRYLNAPSEGNATVYEALNIHIEPSRQSPAFAKIPEGGSVAVLGHKLASKVAAPYRPPTFERPQPVRRSRKERTAKKSILPPPPAPPKPPADLQDLSGAKRDGGENASEKSRIDQQATDTRKPNSKKPAELEDWSLVRTKDKQIGWVLSRNLEMSIPDDVAQYAEGKRITSYFDLGSVQDEQKGIKHNWLWTTSAELEPYDFDAWRVFLWNRRRHRFETSHRQRDVEGYFPVHVDAADPNAFERTFAIITRDDDGRMRQRKYSFDGTRVHLTATEDYHPEAITESAKANPLDTNKLQSKLPRESWLKSTLDSIKRSLTGS